MRDATGNCASRLMGGTHRLVCACCGLWAACWAFATPADQAALKAVRADEARRVQVFAEAARAVVCIFAQRDEGGGGSGVIINADGYGLTNFHVVADLLETRRGYGGLSDGMLYPLTVLGIDPGGDIAMFRLEGRERFDFAPLGDSDLLRVGQWVAAMGNPFTVAEDYTPTITLGVISGLHRYQFGQGEQGSLLEYADCIQVSTSINPGNSGGPLFDMRGRLVGINGRASFEERGRVNVGLGYAVTINQIKRFLPTLRAGRLCEHGTLGATVRRAGNDLIVDAIQDFSPAEQAGVQLGDELIALAGRPVRTANEFNNVLAILPANWPVSITLRRDGREISTATRLERLPLRLPTPWVVDLAHNHAELRRLFCRYERQDRQAEGRRVERLAWSGRVKVTSGNEKTVVSVAVVQNQDDSVRVRTRSRVGSEDARGPEGLGAGSPSSLPTLLLHIDVDGSAKGGLQEPVAIWRDRKLWREWHLLTWPLLSRPEIEIGWEMLAANQVAGHIATVVERRLASGERLRWKFDAQTDRLLELTFGNQAHPESAVWSPGARRVHDGLSWPHTWTRRSQAAGTVVIEVDAFELLAGRHTRAAGTPRPDNRGIKGSRDQGTKGLRGRGSPVCVDARTLEPSAPGPLDSRRTPHPFAPAIESAQRRVVKLHGGTLGREKGYGSGVIVSADGRIVTTLSILLEASSLRVVLPDGRRFPGRVIARDTNRQLALVKIDAGQLPFFERTGSEHLRTGDWVIAAANPFKVAAGPEPVSVAVGVVSGRSRLSARRRAQDFPYRGPVLLTDVIVSSPGSAGGALVDVDGRLVGVIGKAAISKRTNTWVNYALPAEELKAFLDAAGAPVASGAAPAGGAPQRSDRPAEPTLGIRLFDIGARRLPAYVERVRPDSPARAAGVRPNDLILLLAGEQIATCEDFRTVLKTLQPGRRVELVLKRGQQVLAIELTVAEREP